MIRRTISRMLIATTMAASLSVAPWIPGVARADCPGGTVGYHYANSYQSVTLAKAAEAWIGYTDPTLCTNGAGNDQSLEWVNISRTTTNDGWVQHGWMKSRLYTGVRWYCEFNPRSSYPSQNYALVIGGTITSTAHKFTVNYNGGTTEWECLMDGVLKTSDRQSNLGFASGVFLAAGGEAHGPAHIQIGTNAPAKLGLTSMRYFDGTYWLKMNVSYQTPAFPWGSDKPASDEFRDWTNAH